jgi:MFS family permease
MRSDPGGNDRAATALPRFVHLLNAARLSRSVGQGVLAADFALYLRSLHWTGGEIGTLLALALVCSVALTVAFAIPSDRYGRKAFILAYDGLYVLACLAAIASRSSAVLVAGALVSGFGRGANGVVGPFAAIEKAWITQALDATTYARALNLNTTLGFLGMALGAGLAALPTWLAHGAAGAPDYGVIFQIALLSGLVCFGLLCFAEDRHAQVLAAAETRDDKAIRRTENRDLKRLGLMNLLQGAGIGLAGPLTAYWFAVKFGIGPGHVGPIMAVGFLLAAVSSQISTPFVLKYGLIPVIVAQRGAAIVMLVLLPLAPKLSMAVTMYLLFNTLNRASNGPRAAMTASLVRNERRGFAGMVTSVSRQISRSFGPAAAGLMFDAGLLAAPFLASAALQAGYLCLYYRNFRHKDPLYRTPGPSPPRQDSSAEAAT